MVKDQIVTDRYSIYNGDCVNVVSELPDECIDMAVYSPPFSSLYTFSSDPRDMSNVSSNDEFLEQYEFIVKEMARVTKSGRINAIHITDLIDVTGTLEDFPSRIIELHKKYGFEYKNRVTVWKEPLKVRIRTMVKSLMHKHIVEDSTKCFPANPDYILIFKKKGENKIPVKNPCGLQHYAGETPILPAMLKAWNNANKTSFTADDLWKHLDNTKVDGEVSKRNHYIWQRYASSVWDDIRDGNVLPFKDGKDEDDEKHVTPTQLDVIDRLIDLYTNKGEVVLTPFMGAGTEVYSSVSMGRKAIGIELKDSYFKQSKLNLDSVDERFNHKEMETGNLF